jgi:hypothetical protein
VYLVTMGNADEIRDDLTILAKLIEKEQMAHKNLGDVATILRLYDARQEEEHIEAGLSAGQKPEQILPDKPEDQGFLDLLMGSDAVPPAEDCRGQMPTIWRSSGPRLTRSRLLNRTFRCRTSTQPCRPSPSRPPTICGTAASTCPVKRYPTGATSC